METLYAKPGYRFDIMLFRTGDERSLEWLYENYRESLIRHSMKIIPRRDIAEDVVQVVMYKCWLAKDIFNNKQDLTGWLYRVVHDKSVNELKSFQRRVNKHYQIMQSFWKYDTEPKNFDATQFAERAIQELSCRGGIEAEIMNLCFRLGLTYTEAAAELEIPISTATHTGNRALKRIKAWGIGEASGSGGWEIWREFWEQKKKRGMYLDRKVRFLPYKDAKKFVQKLGLTGDKGYRKWSAGGNRPDNIPARPEDIYGAEFEGYTEFLGNTMIPYQELKSIVRKLEIRGSAEYRKRYIHIDNAPSMPEGYYKEEWEGWIEFLGPFERRPRNKKDFISYSKACIWCRMNNIRNRDDYFARRPFDLPGKPNYSYKEDWTNWYDFLGTTRSRKKKIS